MRRTKTKIRVLDDLMTVEEAFDKFMTHCTIKNLTQKTMANYKRDYRLLLQVTTPDTPIDMINIEVIEQLILYMKQESKRKTVSINTTLRTMRAFLYFCMDRDYMDSFKITLLKVDETFKEPYTDEEIKRLLKRPRTDKWIDWRNWAMINYFISTGNRASTVINIKVKDIDFKQNLIKLTHTKNRKETIIPMSVTLNKVLQQYLKLWDYKQDDYLFPSDRNTKLDPHSLQSAIRRYNIDRNVTKTSIHLFRHTFAKMYIINGGGMLQLQKLLGHSTLDMTQKYVNLYGTDLQLNYDKYNPLDNMKQYIK